MSTTISSMPRDACRIEHVSGFINDPERGPNHGKPASIEVWEAITADTLTRWLVVRVEGERHGWADRSYWCKRATGRNLKHLDTNVKAMREIISSERPT